MPAELASGGISGISQLINHLTKTPTSAGWPIGLMVFIGNMPLFILGWRQLGGRRFALRTLVAVAAYSFFADALLWLSFFPKGGITNDLVLNSLYGAVVSGIGYGLVYRGQGTSGGSDILARILHRWRGISMTQSYLLTDTVVILAAGFIFGWQKALYAIITLYVSGLVVDTTMEGAGTVRTAMIISDQCGNRFAAHPDRDGTGCDHPGGSRRLHQRGPAGALLRRDPLRGPAIEDRSSTKRTRKHSWSSVWRTKRWGRDSRRSKNKGLRVPEV